MYQCVMKNMYTAEKTYSERKRKRCGMCIGCTNADCGQCTFCLDKPKFGGPGRKKQCCKKRKCLSLTTHCQPKVAVILQNIYMVITVYNIANTSKHQ